MRARRLTSSLLAAVPIALVLAVPGPPPAAAAVGVKLVWERDLPGVTIRESSPVLANFGSRAVAFGALDGKLYAFDLASGNTMPGWPQQTTNPIDSSPAAVDARGVGTDQLFVGSGIAGSTVAAACSGGGVYAFAANGSTLWHMTGADPDCGNQAFHSSPAVADINNDGVPDVTLGSDGLTMPSFHATNGAMNGGWPYYTDDTVISSPALDDVSGNGFTDVIVGGGATPGGPVDHRGGLVRAINGSGQTIWQFFTDEDVRSSPAVGNLEGTSGPSIVFGTGNFWLNQPGGSNDWQKLFALSPSGGLEWSENLGGVTLGSPSLADVSGHGAVDVIEATAGSPSAPNTGRIWVFDGHGQALPNWAGHGSDGGVVIGSIATADLNGDGAQDLIVPTGAGIWAYDGRTGTELFQLDTGQVGFQNTPLVTDDGNGAVGITVAGTKPDGTGVVQHFQVPSGATIGSGAWPTFHHDARRTGNVNPPKLAVDLCAGKNAGYWLAAADGGLFSFCNATFHGSAGGAPIPGHVVAMVPSKSGNGYWMAGTDGSVYAFGDAPAKGSMSGRPLAAPIVGMARTASGNGYWLVGADGGIYNFGDAAFHGSTGNIRLNKPIVGMSATPTGNGYWLVATDGGIFSFGDAVFVGSTGAITLNQPIVAMAVP